jgi:hypothetical protein
VTIGSSWDLEINNMVKQKKLLLRCADDSIIVMSFVLDDFRGIKREGTKEEIDAEIIRASSLWDPHRLPIKSWEEIEDESILVDRTFRNAWKHEGNKGKFGVDMPKAREIHKEHLRALRTPLFYPLDQEYRLADEVGDTKKKKEVVAKKNILRDITIHPEIEAAKTPEELKTAGLSVLDAFKA